MFRGEMVAFGEALVRPQETKQQCRPTTRLSSYLVVALLLTALTLPAFRHAPAALGIVERGPASEPRVALTFDDGPDPRFTPEILNILEREGVPATFFVVGEAMAAYPDVVKRAADGGFEIANHTYTHTLAGALTPKEIRQEITRTSDLIRQMTGQEPRYLRPPRGELTGHFILEARRQGLRIPLWTIRVERAEVKTPEALARRIVEETENGHIILLHDGRLDRRLTVQALPLIISGLKERGFAFVTLDELLHGYAGVVTLDEPVL